MAMDRIGTAAHSQLFLMQMQKAQMAVTTASQQVSTGKIAGDYAGYETKVATLEAARSAAARADANIETAQFAASRLDLQNAHLSEFERVADEVRQAMTNAMANGDASSLMWRMEDLFSQAVTILNTKDGNSFTYAGENDQAPPVTVSTLADLLALPLVDDAFANGTLERSARIGENRTVQVGLLASDIGKELFTLFRDVAQFDVSPSGPFGSILNTTQDNFLQTKIPEAGLAHTNATAISAANGDRYRLIQNTMEGLRSTSTVYKGFASNLEDVDMGEAIARLQQSQLALQAAYQVSATVGQLSLLDYLGP